MYNEVFVGTEAETQQHRILILGESHHGSSSSTAYVVQHNYFSNPHGVNYRFFENIVRTFGYDVKDREKFWNKAYFGNYMDSLCGIQDGVAKNRLKEKGVRERLNQNLFNFISENRIEYVFCFSRMVYNNLPPLNKELGDCEICRNPMEAKRYRLDQCTYQPRQNEGMKLNNQVTVYGFLHPSRCYSYNRYQAPVAQILAETDILK